VVGGVLRLTVMREWSCRAWSVSVLSDISWMPCDLGGAAGGVVGGRWTECSPAVPRRLGVDVPDPVAEDGPVKGKSTKGGDDEDREQGPYHLDASCYTDVLMGARFAGTHQLLLRSPAMSVRRPASGG